jgi:hypothetical protein
MKRISIIFTFLVVMLFLASSTGISFIIHHCSENHTSELHLFVSDYKCSHELEKDNCCSGTENHSCLSNKNLKHCCSNKKGFIKIVDKYNISREIFSFDSFILTELMVFKFSDFFSENSGFLVNNHGPPKIFNGQDIIKLISVFLI